MYCNHEYTNQEGRALEKLVAQLEQKLAAANARVAELEKELSIEKAHREKLLDEKYDEKGICLSSRLHEAEAQNKRMREALEKILESPYVLVEATIPKGGVDVAPEQVVGLWHVGLIKYRKAKAAWEGKP